MMTTLFIFVLGTCIGSFLNVCISRIPQSISIVKPRSFCLSCKKTLSWLDLIPLFSYLFLRGKCRHCTQPISKKYPLVELLTGLLFVLIALLYPPQLALSYWVLVAFLIPSSLIDQAHSYIPDRFSMGLAFMGITFSAIFPELHQIQPSPLFLVDTLAGLQSSFLGLAVGTTVLLWIRFIAEAILHKEAMGLGDVKLLGGIGAFLGWSGALSVLFGAALLATCCLIPYRILKRQSLRDQQIPFAPWLALATVFALAFRSVFF